MRCLLFDFDYTLAESGDAVINCSNYALEKMNLQKADKEIILKSIGLTLADKFHFITGKDSKEDAQEFTSLFLKQADRVMADMINLFPNTGETIKYLHNKEITLGIISTKFRSRIIQILDRFNLTEYFSLIIGGEDVQKHKPDPEGINTAVQNLNVNKKNLLFIGDTVIDAGAAQNAGVNFIASLTGLTHKTEFNKFNVYRFISDISELKALDYGQGHK